MENKGVLTKILAIAGIVLVWFPILTPILLTTILYIQEQVFRLDYLVPAELFLSFLIGGGILLWAVLQVHSHAQWIGWSLGIAVILLFGGQLIAVVTGLANGITEPAGGWWAVVVASLVIYIVAILETGIGGILLLRDVFKSQKVSTIAIQVCWKRR